MSKRLTYIAALILSAATVISTGTKATAQKKKADFVTHISFDIKHSDAVDEMIYGQMLEDCNDSVIYGGLVDRNGNENPAVRNLLQALDIPVMRWPAGTYIHEYHWKNGIGPKEHRPTVAMKCWGGTDPNTFGTDEFLQWCEKMGVPAYINFNMSNSLQYGGTIGEAIDWMDYTMGNSAETMGKLRARNGRKEPYAVPFWCIGNENYGSYGVHRGETATEYSSRLNRWARAIKASYPNASLLGIGHTYEWNDTVLARNGQLVDFLTLHYYLGARVKDGRLVDEDLTLFAPAKVEANIERCIPQLDKANLAMGRLADPIRYSVDEWNNRHAVYDGKEWRFSRKDPRCQFDAACVAGMLNVFIRQSRAVGMANYIFPVNGHGLVKTVGCNDAFRTSVYHVFNLYRHLMKGKAVSTNVLGPMATVDYSKLLVEGDMNKDVENIRKQLPYIDCAAVLSEDGAVRLALVNRSSRQKLRADIKLGNWHVRRLWRIESDDINASNTASDRNRILPSTQTYKNANTDNDFKLHIKPCGVVIVEFSASTAR